MDKSSRIKELMRKISGTDKPLFHFRLMEVVSVEGDLCTAKIDEFEIPDIRLAVIEGGSENGLLVTPKAGSIVIVADLSCGELRDLAVIGYSEIESFRIQRQDTTVTLNGKTMSIKVGSSTIHVEDGKIHFNGGNNGGLVKIEELRTSFNNLKAFCETMQKAVSAGFNAVGTGTAANGTTGAGAFDSAMSQAKIQIENMENPKITH